MSGCVDVESGSETALKKSVAEVGPVSVSIDAMHPSFQSYKGGTKRQWYLECVLICEID